jgi:hypothetical protein
LLRAAAMLIDLPTCSMFYERRTRVWIRVLIAIRFQLLIAVIVQASLASS